MATGSVTREAPVKLSKRRAPVRDAATEAIAKAAQRCLELREQAKACYAAADEFESTVLATLPLGSVVTLADGRRVAVQDNFATRNVVFRPSAVRRFEIVTVK
jgi:hypothetical protein